MTSWFHRAETEESDDDSDYDDDVDEAAAQELLATQLQTLQALKEQHAQLVRERDYLQQLEVCAVFHSLSQHADSFAAEGRRW